MRLPWRQYAVVPLAGAIIATGLAIGQYRLASRGDRMKSIAQELTIKAVEERNDERDLNARDRKDVRVRETVNSRSRAVADIIDHRGRGQRLLFCALFLLGLAGWLWSKGSGPQRR
jgi:hypothetical protein